MVLVNTNNTITNTINVNLNLHLNGKLVIYLTITVGKYILSEN